MFSKLRLFLLVMRGKTILMDDEVKDIDAGRSADKPNRFPVGLAVLIAVPTLIELTLVLADYGFLGSTRWRSLSYQNFAFWAGLLYNWQPNYPAQPWTMFITYSFSHGGIVHLLGNMLALIWLGQIAIVRIGHAPFLYLYFVSVIGGGISFGLLTNNVQPMVGASGALFGLAGAWQYWSWSDSRASGERVWPVAYTLAALVVLNLVMWVSTKGQLAWETHLGGFVAGGLFAYLWRRVPANPNPNSRLR